MAGQAEVLSLRSISLFAVLLCCSVLAQAVKINIVHVNDVHNRFEAATSSSTSCARADDNAGKCFGGYPRIATFVKEAKKKDPETLFLNAGDEFLGTIWDVVYEGNMTAYYLNKLMPDAIVLGNHEFDYGSEFLAWHVSQLKFPVLGACNMDLTNSTYLKNKIRKYIVRKVHNKTIAIVGITTTDTQHGSSADDNERFYDPVVGLNNCLQELYRNYGSKIDATIVLSHAGYDIDQIIAAEVPGIHLIIGAHTHTFLYNGPTPLKNATNPKSNDTAMGPYPTFVPTVYNPSKSVPIVTAYWASRYAGQLQMDVSGGKATFVSGKPVLLGGSTSSNEVLRDPKMDAFVEDPRYVGPVNEYSSKVLGETLVDLDEAQARYNETAIGNLVADSVIQYVETQTGLQRVDASIVNSGAIRTGIEQGNVTQGEVSTALPYGNNAAVVSITGADLLIALANGFSAYGGTVGTGRFPVLSRLHVVMDPSRAQPNTVDPTAVEDRLVKAHIMGTDGTYAPIDPCATYLIAITDYMKGGGDGYAIFKGAESPLPSGIALDLITGAYISANTPISPQVEGRLINCEYATDPACTSPEIIEWDCAMHRRAARRRLATQGHVRPRRVQAQQDWYL